MRLAAISLLVAMVVCGCFSSGIDNALITLQAVQYPTGIAYWPSGKMVLFSDYAGTVHGVAENTGRVAALLKIQTSDCQRTLRLRVDSARNRLWVMSAAGVCVYDLQTQHLVRHLPLADMTAYHLANGLSDMALDAEGNAYVIDGNRSRRWLDS